MDIETIGIAMDTSDLERGNKALDENAAKANKAADAADRLSDSNKTVAWQNQQMNQTTKQVSASLEDQSFKAQRLADQMYKDAQAADAFMAKLKKMADQAGLTSTEILKQQAAMHGVSEGASDYIAKIEAAEAANHKLSLANAGVTRELAVMGGEAIRGNWTRLEGSMTVLANRTGLLQAGIAAITSPLGLLTAGLGIAAIAVGVLAVKQEELDRTMNGIQARMEAVGHSSMFTSDQIMAMAKSMQLAGGESRAETLAALDALSRYHDISKQLYQDLTTVAVDYAFVQGKKLPDAMKDLGAAFDHPFEGARKLDAEFGMLTSSEVLALEQAKNINDTAAAQAILMEALKRAIGGLHDTAMTPLQQATHDLHLKWDELTTSMDKQNGLRGVVGLFTMAVNGVTSLIDWLDKLDTKLKGITSVPVGPGGIMAALLARGNAAAAGGAKGAATGSTQATGPALSDADADTKKIDEYIKKTLEANDSYRSQAGTIALLNEKIKEQNNAIAIATQEYGEQSPQVAKLKDELAGMNEQMGRKGADALNSQIEALKRFGMEQDELVKQVIQHIQSLQRQGQLTDEQAINAETAAMLSGLGVKEQVLQKELEIAKKKTQSQTEVARISGELDALQIQRNGVLISQQDRIAESQKKSDDAQKKAYDAEMKQGDETIKKVNEQADAIQTEIDHHEKNNKAIQEVIIQRLEEQKTILAGFDSSDKKIQQIQDEIDARKRLVDLMDQKTIQDANDKAAKKAEEEWTSSEKKIEEGLYSAITKGGSNGFKKLMDDVKNWFAHLILQPIIQPIAQFGASLLNPTAASAQGNGLNMFGGSGNFGSMLNMGGFNGDWSLSNVGQSGAGLSGFLGFGGSGVATSSTFNAAMDSQLAYSSGSAFATSGASALSSAIPYVGALFAASQKKYGAAAGMAIGTAIMPGIGTAIGAVVGSIVDSFSKSHGPKTESAYGVGVPTKYTGDASGATSLGQAIQSQYAGYANAFGVNPNISNLGVFYSQDPNGTAKTQLDIHGGSYSRATVTGGVENVGRSSAEFTQAVQLASAQLVLKNLQDAVSGKIGDFLRGINIVNSSLDTINNRLQVAQDVATLDKALDTMGNTFQTLKDASVDATEAFLQNVGGLQSATGMLNSYYQNYYTPAEQKARTAQSIASVLSQNGLNLTGDQVSGMSREQFRALTDAASANPASKLYAALLSVNDAFASITPAADAAAGAIDNTAQQLQDVGKSLWEYARDLGVNRSDTASPTDLLNNSRMAYMQDLALAKGGNYDAYQRFQGDAQAYIDAAKVNYSSGTGTQDIINQVLSDINSLPAVKSYNDQVITATTNGASEVTSAVQALNNSMTAQMGALITQVQTLIAETQNVSQGQAGVAQVTQNTGDNIRDAIDNVYFKGLGSLVSAAVSSVASAGDSNSVINYNDYPGG